MSPFEYVSVIASIVIALGIAKLLGGIADLIRWWRELESPGFFLALQLLLLLHHFGWWFGLWVRHSGTEAFSLALFLRIVTIPGLLFLASHLLVPESGRGRPADSRLQREPGRSLDHHEGNDCLAAGQRRTQELYRHYPSTVVQPE